MNGTARALALTREAAPARPRRQVLLLRPKTMTFALLLAGLFGASALSPYFLDLGCILGSFTLSAEFAMVALVIISGEIDLSPASNMALSACLFADAQQAVFQMPLAILIGLASGPLMGAINGIMVIVLQLASIIVTIGTLTLYRGVAQLIAGDKSIRVPEWFIGIDRWMVPGMPFTVMMLIILSVMLGLVLGTTVYGRQIYLIGTNEIAARHAGIRTKRIKMSLFLAMGLASSFAGLLIASRLGSVRYDLGLGSELQMVLMAMLGGTYIFGGRGTILGTFLAASLLVVASTGTTVANLLPAVQLTVLGILLIVSIIATNAIYSRTQRWRAHRRRSGKGRNVGKPAKDQPPVSGMQRGGTKVKKSMLSGLALGRTFAASMAFADPIKIVYIGKNTGNPYFDSITGGFKDACAAKGCEFEFVAPATAESTSQIPIIEAQIQRGVDVIGIAPNSPDALNEVMDKAKAKGILVITVNGDLVGNEGHRAATILPVDFTKTGPSQVELMGSMIGYKGDIAILSATTEAPDQNTWIAATVDTLKNDPKYKDMRLVAAVYGDDQPE